MDSADRVRHHRERDVVDAVATEVHARGDEWFPGLRSSTAALSVVETRQRPRCTLIRIRLDGAVSRSVIVKVRGPGGGVPVSAGGRPMLQPSGPEGAETGWLEHAGLGLIAAAVPEGDDRFGVVRPLAWLPEVKALVMDDVRHPTLRTALMRTSRLHPRGWRGGMEEAPWRHAGAWLRLFHEAPTDLPLQQRNRHSDDGVLLTERFRAYVTSTGRHRAAADALAGATAAAFRTMPHDLPLGTGHGDFAARNVFVAPDARITVFDPMPRWRVPVYEDLARFVVGLRLLGLQASSHGVAFSRAGLARYERAFLEAYFSPAPVPATACHAYIGLILLDKWSALLAMRGPAGKRARRAAVSRVSEAYYAAEAARVTTILRSDVGATPSAPQRSRGR